MVLWLHSRVPGMPQEWDMAEWIRYGPATGAGGLVIATISKYWVIIGKPINSADSGSGEPDRATRWPKKALQGDFPILAYLVAGL